jgi:hypothetical protein
MDWYNYYKNKLRDNGSIDLRQNKIDEHKEMLIDTFFDSIQYTPVTINDSNEIIHTWIYDGDKITKDTGGKKLKSYPYDTVRFKKGDYINFKYGNEDTSWLLEGLDTQYDFEVVGTIYRCYRNLKWINKNGKIISMPCVIKKDATNTIFNFQKEVINESGTIFVDVQTNIDTDNIQVNQRFLFDGQAFKVTFNETFIGGDFSTLTMIKDSRSPDDDLVNGIANVNTYNYTISIDQGNLLEQQVDYTSTLSATVKNGTEIVNGMELLWKSSDGNICEIQPNGSFILNSEGSCNVNVSLKDNLSVSASITINVVALSVDNYEIRISPNISEILQEDSQMFDVALYHNNIRQSDIVTSIPSGVPSSYYKFTSASNGFTITNLKQYTSSPLVVVCSSGGYSKNISINLSGGW